MTRKFQNCTLHIGTEKTGTTTLQTFLGLNQERLRERGFFVPRSLSPYKVMANHERLTTTSLDEKNLSDDLRRAARVSTTAEVHAHRFKVRQDLASEVSRVDPSSTTLLLSNEHCHSRLVSFEEVQRLSNFLHEFTEQVEVVVYLRPQHELAVSLYDQAMKAGYYDIELLPRFAENERSWVSKGYFNYEDLLQRWGSVFGQTQIVPRLFVRDELLGGSIIDDFMSYLSCDVTGLVKPENKNTSISENLQLVLNAFNRFAARNEDKVPPRTRPKLIAALESLSSGPGKQPTRDEATSFYNVFQASNENVRSRYFVQREALFDLDVSQFPSERGHAVPEQDALVSALVAFVQEAERPVNRT